MKYSIVKSDYNFDNNNIHLYCRDENYKKVTKTVAGFSPYAYTSEKNKEDLLMNKEVYLVEPVSIPFIEEDSDKQVVFKTESPKHIGEIRKNSPFPVHEADIPFPRRYMIDHGIFSGFELDETKDICRPSEPKAISFTQKPRISFFDIETDIKTDTITINCIYDSLTNKYLSIAVDPDGKVKKKLVLSENHVAYIVPSEKELLEYSKRNWELLDPDVISAWYIDFDMGKIEEKSKKYDIKFDFKSSNIYDLLEPYKKLHNKGSNKLSEVVLNEDIEVPDYEVYQQRFWKESINKAILVNKSHVETLVKLDEHLEIIDTFWNFKAIAGFEDLYPTLYHGSIIDILLLRSYHRKYILPSKPSKELKKQRAMQIGTEKIGGKVFDPPYGAFMNAAFYDMSRYYPELIIAQNLTYEKVKEGDIGVLPELSLYLISERLKYDNRLNKLDPSTDEYRIVKHLRDDFKAILNSIFGYTGYEGARLFRLDIFNGITIKGQDGLVFCGEKASGDGKELIYGDTDSVCILTQNNEDSKILIKDKELPNKLLEDGLDKENIYSVAHAIEYTDVLNKYLEEFCLRNNFKRNISLKMDRFFSGIVFKKIRVRENGTWIERGAKKRYFGEVIYEKKPTKYLKIVGFEVVRKDSANITKKMQEELFKIILTGNNNAVLEYIKNTVEKLKESYIRGDLHSSLIAIPTKLSKAPNEYGGVDKNGDILTPPDYVRGAIFANEWMNENIGASDQVFMLYVKRLPSLPQTDVISYTSVYNLPKDLVIDIDKHIERTIKMPLEKVIDSVDLTWKDIFTPNNKLW